MEKREPSYNADRNVKWYTHCRKEQLKFLKKTKNRTNHMIQQFHSWVYTQKKNENNNLKGYMHPNFHSSSIYNS